MSDSLKEALEELFQIFVRPAVEWLDKEHPGWAKHINTAELEMGDTVRCVLAQLYSVLTGDEDGCYYRARDYFDPPVEIDSDCFSMTIVVQEIEDFHFRLIVNLKIDEIWIREIRKRTLPVHTCQACGGSRVEVAAWVNPNTDEIGDDFGTFGEADTHFCNDCEGAHGITLLAAQS